MNRASTLLPPAIICMESDSPRARDSAALKDSPPDRDLTDLTLPVKLSSTSMSSAVWDLLLSSSALLRSSNLPPDMSESLRLAHWSTLSK